MTTRVIILNEGPDDVLVDRVDPTGQSAQSALIIPAGCYDSEYVHDSQELVIREKKR